MRRSLAVLAALSLSGCLAHGGSLPKADRALAGIDERPPEYEDFTYCSDHSCEIEHPVGLKPEDWAIVTQALVLPPDDASSERAAIALTVGFYEQVVGPRTGTAKDPGGTGVFAPRGDLDCVDEAVNTTRLLKMLDEEGLLRFHRPGWPVHRAFVGGSRTHMTAVMREIGGQPWAVDSWFHPSGHPAEVVELERWLEGWEPGQSAAAD